MDDKHGNSGQSVPRDGVRVAAAAAAAPPLAIDFELPIIYQSPANPNHNSVFQALLLMFVSGVGDQVIQQGEFRGVESAFFKEYKPRVAHERFKNFTELADYHDAELWQHTAQQLQQFFIKYVVNDVKRLRAFSNEVFNQLKNSLDVGSQQDMHSDFAQIEPFKKAIENIARQTISSTEKQKRLQELWDEKGIEFCKQYLKTLIDPKNPTAACADIVKILFPRNITIVRVQDPNLTQELEQLTANKPIIFIDEEGQSHAGLPKQMVAAPRLQSDAKHVQNYGPYQPLAKQPLGLLADEKLLENAQQLPNAIDPAPNHPVGIFFATPDDSQPYHKYEQPVQLPCGTVIQKISAAKQQVADAKQKIIEAGSQQRQTKAKIYQMAAEITRQRINQMEQRGRILPTWQQEGLDQLKQELECFQNREEKLLEQAKKN